MRAKLDALRGPSGAARGQRETPLHVAPWAIVPTSRFPYTDGPADVVGTVEGDSQEARS